jgi:hypothetical protein
MITLMTIGAGLLVLIAAVVRVMEAAQAPAWRLVAAQRRARWEAAARYRLTDPDRPTRSGG